MDVAPVSGADRGLAAGVAVGGGARLTAPGKGRQRGGPAAYVTPLGTKSLPTPVALDPMPNASDQARQGKGISSLVTMAAVRL